MAPKQDAVRDLISKHIDAWCAKSPDGVAGDHAVYVWTFTGTHAESGKKVSFQGWEEWELTDEPRVRSSLGWYDAEDYERQLQEKS